jgi:hypothetical protein
MGLNIEDPDGYPRYKVFRKLADLYEKREHEKHPEKYAYLKNQIKSTYKEDFGFTNPPDRPSRFRI